ncbi:hypothetical protein EYZ11_003233 [Aspergillus tanneri]|uniref:Uncharacterized protein n=1 Tax=Aspergillus tanneri TaxID=1220188 RepID=A0A4S3JNZ7_9EURO|nr:hypothetical protein EYZ11_003233 [Aspergillus tanneri]
MADSSPRASPAPDTTPPVANHTCHHPYHSQYSESNLPPLLFRMDQPLNTQLGVLSNLIENGQEVTDHEGSAIRDFPFLPRYISSQPPTWLLEYWMRTDYRLTYRDIKARMTTPEDQKPTENALNMRREREVRAPLSLSCWTARRGRANRISRIDIERVEFWTIDQVKFNTTMEIEYRQTETELYPVPFRLRAKSLASAPVATVYYPLDTFLEGDGSHAPSSRITVALDIFYELSERALARGMDSWRQLPAHDIPVSWKPYSDTGRPSAQAGVIVDLEEEDVSLDDASSDQADESEVHS